MSLVAVFLVIVGETSDALDLAAIWSDPVPTNSNPVKAIISLVTVGATRATAHHVAIRTAWITSVPQQVFVGTGCLAVSQGLTPTTPSRSHLTGEQVPPEDLITWLRPLRTIDRAVAVLSALITAWKVVQHFAMFLAKVIEGITNITE